MVCSILCFVRVLIFLLRTRYDAIKTWNKFITSPDSEYWVQLSPGTAVVINNHRVLHGRSAFDGARRMCGAYIGMDEFCSKLLVLSERFAPHSVSSIPAGGNNVGAKFNGRSVWNPAL